MILKRLGQVGFDHSIRPAVVFVFVSEVVNQVLSKFFSIGAVKEDMLLVLISIAVSAPVCVNVMVVVFGLVGAMPAFVPYYPQGGGPSCCGAGVIEENVGEW